MSYAGLLSKGWANPAPQSDCTYNVNPSSMAPVRAAIGQRFAKLVPWLNDGDSLTSGYQVVPPETLPLTWPGALRSYLGAQPGYIDGGSIVASADALTQPQWNGGAWPAQWTFTAGAIWVSNAAAVTTYVSTDVGTATAIYYLDNAGGNITYTVDGVAQAAIVRGGTNLIKMAVAVGFANTVHTIAITAAAASVYIAGASVFGPNGILWGNLAQTSSGITAGYSAIAGTKGAWSSMGLLDLGYNRIGMANLHVGAGYGRAVVNLNAGSNDIANGVSPTAVIAGYEQILLNYAPLNPAFIVVSQFRQPTVTDAAWAVWIKALQAFALKHNFPMFDWNAIQGGYSALLAAGLLQSDATHPTAGASVPLGQLIGDLLL